MLPFQIVLFLVRGQGRNWRAYNEKTKTWKLSRKISLFSYVNFKDPFKNKIIIVANSPPTHFKDVFARLCKDLRKRIKKDRAEWGDSTWSPGLRDPWRRVGPSVSRPTCRRSVIPNPSASRSDPAGTVVTAPRPARSRVEAASRRSTTTTVGPDGSPPDIDSRGVSAQKGHSSAKESRGRASFGTGGVG